MAITNHERVGTATVRPARTQKQLSGGNVVRTMAEYYKTWKVLSQGFEND
jgi:hypothetical protein